MIKGVRKIQDAPKDGKEALLLLPMGGGEYLWTIGRWNGSDWVVTLLGSDFHGNEVEPSHWAPLPPIRPENEH